MKPGQDLWDQLKIELDVAFATVLDDVLDQLLDEGIVLRPYSGLRSPLEQAVLWCQSRTPLEAELLARRFDDEGATFLSSVIRRAAIISRPGRWATNNLPGQSWHNFGLALDAHVVSEDGRAVWGPKHHAYAKFAEVARARGLHPGFDLVRQDVVHVQLTSSTVRSVHGPWIVIDRELKQRFPTNAG